LDLEIIFNDPKYYTRPFTLKAGLVSSPPGSRANRINYGKGEVMRMLSTSDVLDRHLKAFADRDLGGVLADYSTDAVLFAPTGPLKGPDAIKPLFQALVSEFAKPGSSFTMQQRSIEGDHAYIVWTAETADNSYEFATDTFVVRNGKIIAQSFAAKIKPKR
jgi:hypothetical protein